MTLTSSSIWRSSMCSSWLPKRVVAVSTTVMSSLASKVAKVGDTRLDLSSFATVIVREWLGTLSSVEAERRLRAHHVVVGVVKTLPEAIRQPQVQARGLLARVEDPVFGDIEVVNSASKYTRAESAVRGPAPRLGEHNGPVLREVLGYDDARVQALIASGVLRSASE